VVAGLFVGLFVESPHQVLEEVAHGDVGDAVRVQVNRSHSLDHFEQAVVLFELLDLFLELELLEDLAGTGREAANKARQVGGQLVGVPSRSLWKVKPLVLWNGSLNLLLTIFSMVAASYFFSAFSFLWYSTTLVFGGLRAHSPVDAGPSAGS
jgi:hypothetical protein